jgi:2-polyprenyl-3-methyl-5-hydroxy-6-metoxy-1,4-benzoquinol methylase
MSSTSTLDAPYDQQAAEAFETQIASTLNAGAIAVMISIGHKSRLFDVMAGLPPSSAQQIADAARLAERYVREWLAVMVTGGIVRYDPARRTYHLPPEHAACLTRAAPVANLAVYAQSVALIGAMEERLLARFADGQGLPYEAYPCFHQTMAEDSAQTVVAPLFELILPLAPELPARLAAGIDVLDAGCGAGLALVAMAERYPRSRFTGYDLCADAIARADATAEQAGLRNVHFAVQDMSGFAEAERYDLITTFDAVHDQKDPQALLASLHRALRPGGVHLMQDIGGSARLENNLDFPLAAFLYAISCAHCMPVSLAQGGEGLGTMWGWETAERMLRTAGFAAPERHVLQHDPMNVWFVARKS